MADTRRELVRLLQEYAGESARLAQAFSERHGLHTTDLQALMVVLTSEARGIPLTTGGLGGRLGLSSGATTALVDRLERHGYVWRDRDEGDRRRIVLRYGEAAADIGRAFFGPLGTGMEALLAGWTDAELAVVTRFLTGATALVATRRAEVADSRAPTDG